MDFQFTLLQGQVMAKCSMEHFAVANWFNTEVPSNSQLISTALAQLQIAKSFTPEQESQLFGKEYSLFINADEVMIRANNLAIHQDTTELEPDFHYYDEESIAFLGLEDFERFLRSYLEFVG
ncbi:YacL family protein [Lonepinella sp. BR2474]|uniref:YacL family protein n=1 Tax=Lonepinella sp. BR2474 TaxID=3434548 RepID=UPI003F6E07D8